MSQLSTVSTLGAREASSESGETYLNVLSVSRDSQGIVIDAAVVSDTYFFDCPTVVVKAVSGGRVLDERTVGLKGDYDILQVPPTLDFYNCGGSVRLRVPGGTSQVAFRVESTDGEVWAAGDPILLQDLQDRPEVPGEGPVSTPGERAFASITGTITTAVTVGTSLWAASQLGLFDQMFD